MNDLWPLIASLEEGVVVITREGKLESFNASALALLGLTDAELSADRRPAGWQLTDLDFNPLPPFGFDPAMVRANVGPIRAQQLVHFPTGGTRELMAVALALPNDRVGFSWLDLSPELELVNELRVFERLFELSGDLLLVTDARLQVIHSNEAALNLIGLGSRGRKPATLDEFIHADDLAPARNYFSSTEPASEFTCRVRSAAGEWRDVAWSVSRSRAGNQALIFLRGHDVTARLTELQDIKRSRELLAEAFDLADLAVLEQDLASGTSSATPRFFELLALPETSAAPAHIETFLFPEDLGTYRDYREKLLAGQTPAPITVRLRTGTGELRNVRMWVRLPGRADGRESRQLTVVQDVTQQSLLQAQLRLTDRLTSLGTMAAGVAHEINNPLAFVLGNLNVVRSVLAPIRDIPGVDLTDLRDAVNEALEGAERVRQIVSSLKPFSRVDETHRGHCDIARIVQASLNMAKNELRHRARIVTDIRPVGPVLGNEAKLSQVFINLLVNAAQAMPDGHAEENLVTVTSYEERGTVVVTVSDTGSGIPPEVLPRIFDPFYSTKEIGKGTGLGLFVSQGIVQELGGTLAVTSRPGATRFEVRLPVTELGYTGTATTPVPTRKRARILVIDDEPAILRTLERMLGRHELTMARSGKEALALLSTGLDYDLVLCDLMMPEVSGMDIWDHLNDRQRSHCVFMTGGTFTERAEKFLNEKAPPLLEKPFTTASLERLLPGPAVS